MANTYTQIYLQFVFAVQNRNSLILPKWKDELYKYISGIISNNKHKLMAINGTKNHVHILIGYKPLQLIPDLLQDIKGNSSTWINKRRFIRGKFRWQKGYGAFSYGHSQIDFVVKCIMNQESRHQTTSFADEYNKLLNCYNIYYDDRYVLKDIL